jgi:hypothetical protein
MAPTRLAAFDDLLARLKASAPIATDDAVGAMQSLIEAAAEVHARGAVIALDRVDLLGIDAKGALSIGTCPIVAPSLAEARVASVEQRPSEALDVTRLIGVAEGGPATAVWDRTIAEPGSTPEQPMFWLNYGSWERAVGHHDALTDVYHLGLIFASLATGLDLREKADLVQFVQFRTNLVRLNPRLHPVVARIVADMTELARHKRAADLAGVLEVLDDYRAVEVDDAQAKRRDLAAEQDPVVRRTRTLEYFRNRLFEVTRRNKLLYYSDRHGVDLTRGSLPNMLNVRTLKADRLLTAAPAFLERLAGLHDGSQPTGDLDLRRWLQYGDYPFLAPQLDKIRAAARKDLRELGFNQLRLVLAMLRWFTPDSPERIDTPLLLAPVTLKKQAGTTDGYALALDAPLSDCEVNPVLRFMFAETFRIDLPASLDLTDPKALPALRAQLEADVRTVQPGTAIALVDRPRIALIQKTVMRQLDEHQRKQKRAGQDLRDWRGIAYSYAEDNFQPLGLELFDRFVRAHVAPGRDAAQTGSVQSGLDGDAAATRTATVESYALDAYTSDRLNWEIDLCAVTLANFNTRKMSLVRDYELLLGGYGGENATYKRLFEHGARPQLARLKKVPHGERNLVLPSDPSQDEAILRARTGESYVIQGPPGTGKSQTIANLLADLAASGKSVLFVCAKRVALDVVHRRLKDAGLADLASLVHDAREDRTAFIADVKKLYQEWSTSRPSRTIEDKRTAVVAEIEALIGRLEAFSAAMTAPAGGGPFHVRGLMDRALADNIPPPRLSNREREQVPSWQDFLAGETALAQIERAVADTGNQRTAIAALLRTLRADVSRAPQPVAFLEQAGREARDHLEEAKPAVRAAVPPRGAGEASLETALRQSVLSKRLRVLAELDKLNLIDTGDPEANRLQKQLQQLAKLDEALAQAESATRGWTRKPGPQETEQALAVARAKEGSFFAFLSGDWRRVKQLVAINHKGAVSQHAAVLEQLLAEHTARAQRDEHAGKLRSQFALDDIEEVAAALAPHWQAAGEPADPHERMLIEACRRAPTDHARKVIQLAGAQAALERARDSLSRLFHDFETAPLDRIEAQLDTLDQVRDRAVDLARRLEALERVSPALATAWRRLAFETPTFKAASLYTSIARALANHPEAESLGAAEIEQLSRQLSARLADLRELNSRRTLDRQKARFRRHLTATDRGIEDARRFLEHQFALTRPSAAMRDFLTGPRAKVVGDLKPIWMMSPLSVADTLPLDEGLFDVVVFDEASQIPIEDGVPTLYRARQSIIVGDEMQLPPASYFSKKSEDDDGDALPDYIAYGMQTESLLDKAIVALPGTRLDWHYRSRHEALIGFCNQAFYDGALKTIPSRQSLTAGEPIDPAQASSQKAQAQRVLERPISYHRVAEGVFSAQTNQAEAAYIAELVRALLAQDEARSIGIVAFSQPQQVAIEDALDKLARANQTFRGRLDAAFAREDEELFVKNLENVQGDERDIMIVSVAYAPNAEGRMVMNFGPINQEGGEKRLNVIFSRAKHHVALVTSIDPARITNDYNPGARALKRYMMYAQAASIGDAAGMRVALAGYPGAARVDQAGRVEDPLAEQIAAAEAARGNDVVRGVGQSTARCDVAIRKPGAKAFTTAILTDNLQHYAVEDVVERYVTYPDLLRINGWEVRLALAKDLLAERHRETHP